MVLFTALMWQRMLIVERNRDRAQRAQSEQTAPQGHVNKPRERRFLAIRGRYFAENIGRANLHRNQQRLYLKGNMRNYIRRAGEKGLSRSHHHSCSTVEKQCSVHSELG